MKSKNLWSVTSVCVALLSGLFATASFAKLPEPTPEAKAKAAEAKAKTAWSDKVAAYQLCKSQDKVAAAYLKEKTLKRWWQHRHAPILVRMCRKLRPPRCDCACKHCTCCRKSKSCLVKYTYSPLKWHFTLNLLVDIGLPDILRGVYFHRFMPSWPEKIMPDSPYMPELSRSSVALTKEVQVTDERGRVNLISIPAERPLTVYLDKRELVTLMTMGGNPEALVLGYLRNQRLLRQITDIASVQVDWEVSAAAVVTHTGVTDIEERTSKRVVTTGCGQGTVFGG
jgi:hypothetical protein